MKQLLCGTQTGALGKSCFFYPDIRRTSTLVLLSSVRPQIPCQHRPVASRAYLRFQEYSLWFRRVPFVIPHSLLNQVCQLSVLYRYIRSQNRFYHSGFSFAGFVIAECMLSSHQPKL